MFKWSDQKDIYKIIYPPKSNYKNNVSDGHLFPWLAARNSHSWDIKFCNQKFQRFIMDNRLKKKIGRRKKRTRDNQILSRLTYCPKKDKGRFTEKLRAKLQQKVIHVPLPPVPTTTIEIGAININGMDMESSWALEQIVSKYSLQVFNN